MGKTIYSDGRGTTVALEMPSMKEALKGMGIDKQGKVQKFFTRRAKMRMDKYTPRREGVLISTAIVRPTEIEYIQPYSRPMYLGISPLGNPINYTGAPQRGAFWDEKMMANDGDQLVQETQEYSDRLRGDM